MAIYLTTLVNCFNEDIILCLELTYSPDKASYKSPMMVLKIKYELVGRKSNKYAKEEI